MTIRIRPEGADVIIEITHDGKVVASELLDVTTSGALGGQLLSAAHAPLQGPYVVEGTVGSGEDALEAPEALPTPAGYGAVTPRDIATRARTVTPPVAAAPSALVYDSSNLTAVRDWDAAWEISRRAQEQMEQLGVSREQVIAAASDPEYTTPPTYGTGTNHIRDGIMVLVAADDPRVIIGISADTIEPAPATAPIRRVSGGPGRRMPSRFPEIAGMLADHGFLLEHTKRGPHDKATHPAHPGVTLVIPHTPSDHRAYLNCIAEIRRQTGIDITQPAKVWR